MIPAWSFVQDRPDGFGYLYDRRTGPVASWDHSRGWIRVPGLSDMTGWGFFCRTMASMPGAPPSDAVAALNAAELRKVAS